jgi:hypothetical protein
LCIAAVMSTREDYMEQAASCLRAALKLRDPAERAALSKLGACYVALADYVAERSDHGTAHRRDDEHGLQHPDS